MSLISMLWEWRFVIIVAAAFLLYCAFEWQRAKAVLYNLMLQAKRMAKDAVLKSGKEQEDLVVRFAMQRLPLSLRLFMGEDTIRKIVSWLFSKSRDILDDGILNDSQL